MHNLSDESQALLNAAVNAATAAGAVLRKEFNRPGGPHGDKINNKAECVEEDT